MMRMWNIQKKTTNIKEQKAEVLTNVFGTIQLTQSLIPHLSKQKNSFILNISSAVAYAPMSVMPVYSATKAALHSYSISIREQLQNTNIKVFELLPPGVDTEMARVVEKAFGIDMGPKMAPDELAILTLKGLKNDTYEIRPGMTKMLYILSRIFPSLVKKMFAKE